MQTAATSQSTKWRSPDALASKARLYVKTTAIECLVINLEGSTDRLAFQKIQAAKIGLSFTRMRAIAADEIDDATFGRFGSRWQRPLSRSEVACLLSHAKAWEYALKAGRPVLVLEDDAVISPRTRQFLESLSTEEFELINLETRLTGKFVSRQPVGHYATSGTRLYKLFVDHGGSAAYVIHPSGASRLLQRLDTHAAPADAYLMSRLTPLQADPALAMPLDYTIRKKRFARRNFGRTIAETTIPNRRGNSSRMVREAQFWFLQPQFKLRRLVGYLTLATRKVRNRKIAIKRPIAPCESIDDVLQESCPELCRADRAR